jgi:hypothetical protein
VSDECASKHEIQELCEARQVESEGAAGKCGVLPREASPEAVVAEKLKLEVSASQSGVDRPWQRKFLGFRLSPEGMIEGSAKALEKFREQVRQLWESRQNQTSTQLRDLWGRYLRGWWEYYRLTGNPKPLLAQGGWIRRRLRQCFWQRWPGAQGRLPALRQLGVSFPLLLTARSGRGAWRMAKHPGLHTGLSNQTLRRYGFLCFADLRGQISETQPPDASKPHVRWCGRDGGQFPPSRPDLSIIPAGLPNLSNVQTRRRGRFTSRPRAQPRGDAPGKRANG